MSPTEIKRPNDDINIRQLARELKVAICTVSRALAGAPGVSKKKAEVIRQRAALMGYKPQPLRRKRTKAVSLLITSDHSNIADDLYQQVITLHLERVLSTYNEHVHVEFIPRSGDKLVWPATLAENRVDGVVLTGHPSLELCQRIRQENIPVVVISDTAARTQCSCVLSNFIHGTSDVIERLISLGHREIGMVVTQREFPTVEMRYQSYLKAMNEHGLEPDSRWIISGVTSNLSGGREAVIKFLERGALPRAILFTNDWMAMGGANELIRRGYRVPEDVSIVGYDNVSISEEFYPPLTSIDGQVERLIAEAVDLLHRQIEGDMSVVQKEIPSFLVWRKSCFSFTQSGK